jgi:DNA-directed RNA polymerase specialized sigma24 family protein
VSAVITAHHLPPDFVRIPDQLPWDLTPENKTNLIKIAEFNMDPAVRDFADNSGLTEPQREVYILRFYWEATESEIAHILGRDQRRVSKSLTLALVKMKEHAAPRLRPLL